MLEDGYNTFILIGGLLHQLSPNQVSQTTIPTTASPALWHHPSH